MFKGRPYAATRLSIEENGSNGGDMPVLPNFLALVEHRIAQKWVTRV